MGDDVDAPHNSEFTIADNTSIATIIEKVLHSNYLASIEGGNATWSAVSNFPLAVLAQQWISPKMLPPVPPLATLNFADNTLSLHFHYYAQQNPDLVYDQLYNAQTRRNQQ
jgi:hypothetical protein